MVLINHIAVYNRLSSLLILLHHHAAPLKFILRNAALVHIQLQKLLIFSNKSFLQVFAEKIHGKLYLLRTNKRRHRRKRKICVLSNPEGQVSFSLNLFNLDLKKNFSSKAFR